MKSSKLYLFGIGLSITIFWESCHNQNKDVATETITSGAAAFVADESFAPIVDEELYVFKNLNAAAKPKIIYKPENQVVGMMLNDSVRFAILSRKLTGSEVAILKKRQLVPDINMFAIDAVAIIVNQASNDTTITTGQLKKMLSGDTKSGTNIVFDNPNSSIVKYLQNFSGSNILNQKGIYSLKSDKEVINYVSTHPGTIGITGFSWLNDPDKDYADAEKKVKVVSVGNDSAKNTPVKFYQPSQTTIALKQYPLIRDLYIVNNTGKMGLGSGFENFVMSERGQRIILRSGLLPADIPERDIVLKNN